MRILNELQCFFKQGGIEWQAATCLDAIIACALLRITLHLGIGIWVKRSRSMSSLPNVTINAWRISMAIVNEGVKVNITVPFVPNYRIAAEFAQT